MASKNAFLVFSSVICLFAVGRAATVNGPTTVTLANGACTGVEFDKINSKFSYKLQLNNLSDQSCLESVRVSKLYVESSCINTRDNQIGLSSYKSLTCSEADSTDTSVCNLVFSAGPSDATIAATNSTIGNTYDEGAICANQDTAFVYLKSTCSQSTDVTLTFSQSDYDGPVCAKIAGRNLSGWAIAIIVVGAFIFLVVFTWILTCCCCKACCCF